MMLLAHHYPMPSFGASISLADATSPMYSLSFSFGEEKMLKSMFHVV